MRVSRRFTAPGLALAVFFARPAAAPAAEITVFTARALATVLAEVGPEFERTTGHRLAVTTGLAPEFVARARAHEPFDLLITGSGPLGLLIEEGRLVAHTRTDLARSGIGVAVRAGAAKPDITSVAAFERALLAARSIAFLRDVGSGLHVARLLQRLGISEAVQSKVTRPDRDIVCELVARGEVELGIVVITQILTTPGVELAGPLPPEIQSHIAFAGAVSATSKQPAAAQELLRFLTGPVAAAVIKAQGMEPAPRRPAAAPSARVGASSLPWGTPVSRALP